MYLSNSVVVLQLQNDVQTLISSCMFVVACLIQLLLFYWHANEVTRDVSDSQSLF